jgi:hypothetical protein
VFDDETELYLMGELMQGDLDRAIARLILAAVKKGYEDVPVQTPCEKCSCGKGQLRFEQTEWDDLFRAYQTGHLKTATLLKALGLEL